MVDANSEDALGEMLTRVQIPLENVEFTIDQYLLRHGARLDIETRFLLARVRDCVGRVASSTRTVTSRDELGPVHGTPPVQERRLAG